MSDQIEKVTAFVTRQTAGGYLQVTYREWDQLPEPRTVAFQITGWVPEQTVVVKRRRYFYQLEDAPAPPARWTVEVDFHRFELFWAPLAGLPEIVPTQAGRLEMLRTQDS